MLRTAILALVLLVAAAWGAFARLDREAPVRHNPRPAQESGPAASLPQARPEASPALVAAPDPTVPGTPTEPPSDLEAQALEWGKHPTLDRVDEALRAYRESPDPRRKAIALYILARSRRVVAHAGRDAVLSTEAVPFLRDVTLAPATDATRPAILALSALGDPEAARILALAARDPREPQKAEEAISALIVRPDRCAVGALEDLARARASGSARLRAVRALLTAAALWGPQAEDLDARAALAEARRFLEWEGPGIADSVGRGTRVVELQEDARSLSGEIETFFHGTNQ